MLPPVSVPAQTRIVNGRTYSSTPGNVVDVLDSDAAELQSNGWVWICPSGTTSARPSTALGLNQATPGQQYYDTTVSKLIVYDGATWRDPSTGGAA
jgi:hypothetical protein